MCHSLLVPESRLAVLFVNRKENIWVISIFGLDECTPSSIVRSDPAPGSAPQTRITTDV